MMHTILVLSPVKQLFALILLYFKCTLNALAVVLEEATALAVANKKISILLCRCYDFIHSVIQEWSLTKCLLEFSYVPSTPVGTGDKAMNKADKTLQSLHSISLGN